MQKLCIIIVHINWYIDCINSWVCHFTLIVCARQPSIPEQHIKHTLLRCDFFFISTLHCVLDWRALQMHWCHRFLKCFWNFQAFAILTSPPRHTFAPNLPKLARNPTQREIRQKWGIREKKDAAKMRNPRKMSKSGRTEMWAGFGQFGQHLAPLACSVEKFCSLR